MGKCQWRINCYKRETPGTSVKDHWGILEGRIKISAERWTGQKFSVLRMKE